MQHLVDVRHIGLTGDTARRQVDLQKQGVRAPAMDRVMMRLECQQLPTSFDWGDRSVE